MKTVAKKNSSALLLLGAAGVVTGLIFAIAPPEREVSSLGAFLVKLVPFVLAAEGIAHLDLDDRARGLLLRIAVPVCFLVFFCYFVPKIFFYRSDHPKLYVTIMTLTAFIILSFVLAFRLGGGTSQMVRRLAYSLLLLMVSGVEDLAYLTVNNHTDPQWSTIPERWDWASHMRVRLGHYPTKYEAYAFIAVHVVAAFVVLFAPVPQRLRRGRGSLAGHEEPERQEAEDMSHLSSPRTGNGEQAVPVARRSS